MHASLRGQQYVPGWGGFISLLGEKPARKTTLGYYPVIKHPITDYRTVKERLRIAEEATHEVGQDYVITTFDLGVCMKAFPLIRNKPEVYKNHIILMGTFHVVCAYFKMIGKKMDGSGLSEILHEAGFVSSGSVKAVLSGTNYDRALHCQKVTVEALDWLMLQTFLKTKGGTDLFPKFTDDTNELLKSTRDAMSLHFVQELLETEDVNEFLTAFSNFREEVCEGKHGKTAMLWMSYIHHIRLVLCLVHAVKTNNFELYAGTLMLMPDIFFSVSVV